MNNKEKYLLITKWDTIEEKCSGCSIAGINLHYFKNKSDCVRKLVEVFSYANVKVIGIYKAINKFTINKNFQIEELLDERN